ncbi:Uncharacterised protein [Enterococcus saccharolyticus]|nr:Uncharacterised protein [Enterococcus saccharolyticus]
MKNKIVVKSLFVLALLSSTSLNAVKGHNKMLVLGH